MSILTPVEEGGVPTLGWEPWEPPYLDLQLDPPFDPSKNWITVPRVEESTDYRAFIWEGADVSYSSASVQGKVAIDSFSASMFMVERDYFLQLSYECRNLGEKLCRTVNPRKWVPHFTWRFYAGRGVPPRPFRQEIKFERLVRQEPSTGVFRMHWSGAPTPKNVFEKAESIRVLCPSYLRVWNQ